MFPEPLPLGYSFTDVRLMVHKDGEGKEKISADSGEVLVWQGERLRWRKGAFDEDTEISFFVVSDVKDDDYPSETLAVIAQAKGFQTYAKQIRFFSLSRLCVNDWGCTFETFAQQQGQHSLRSLSLEYCHLTDQGARALAFALESNRSGIRIDSLTMRELTGSNKWISGLYKNTTIKHMELEKLGYGHLLLEFLVQCRMSQFKDIRLQVQSCTFCLRRPASVCSYPPHSPLSLDMGYSSGNIHLGLGKYRYQFGDLWEEDIWQHPEDTIDPDPMNKFWEIFQHFLTFQKEQPRELRFALSSSSLTGCLPLFQTVVGYNATIKKLELHYCTLTEEDANNLGWLLDSDGGEVNVEHLKIVCSSGSNAWAYGLYKNSSIKSLHLDGLYFWHSVLHFLHTAAHKLENIHLNDIYEEKDGEPLVKTDETPNLISLENWTICMTQTTRNDNVRPLSKHLCQSIGSCLRHSPNLESLNISYLKKNSEYDFLHDAVSCKEIRLTATDFEPLGIASLINDGGQLKRVHLDFGFCTIGLGKVTKLLRHIDLTLLDEFDTGGTLTPDILSILCQQFCQNKGPRKLAMMVTTEVFFPVVDNGFGTHEELFSSEHIMHLAASLRGNTKIEKIKLGFGTVDSLIMLTFLQSVCDMPSLQEIKISARRQQHRFDMTRQSTNLKRCQHFIMRQLLERNVWINLPLVGEKFSVMVKKLRQGKLLLGHDINDLPDGIWAHILAYATKTKHGFESETDMTALFCLLQELPRLFQEAGDQIKYDQQGPHFVVPHHPCCPGCHKQQKVDVLMPKILFD